MPKLSPLMLAPPLVFFSLALLFYVGMMRENPNGLPSTFIGEPAPEIAPRPLGPYPVIEDAALRGPGVKVINFWASWCPPCRAEHPTLMQMAADGYTLWGINFKDTETQAVEYLQKYENPFSALTFDPKGATQIDWGVTAPPETFIVDGQGRVLYRYAGPLVGSDYQQRFLPELQKALAAEPR